MDFDLDLGSIAIKIKHSVHPLCQQPTNSGQRQHHHPWTQHTKNYSVRSQHTKDDDDKAHTTKLESDHGSRRMTDANDIQLGGTIKSGEGGDATITTTTTASIDEDIDAVLDITELGSMAKSGGGNSSIEVNSSKRPHQRLELLSIATHIDIDT